MLVVLPEFFSFLVFVLFMFVMLASVEVILIFMFDAAVGTHCSARREASYHGKKEEPE